MNKVLTRIRNDLSCKSEKEAYKLFRLAWRAAAHGCSSKTVSKIRAEADWCFRTGTAYPERLVCEKCISDFQFAFKY